MKRGLEIICPIDPGDRAIFYTDQKPGKTPIDGSGMDSYFYLLQKLIIMKVLHCRDAGYDCAAVIRDTSEEVVMEKAARHAQDVHGATLTPESSYEIRSLIRDE